MGESFTRPLFLPSYRESDDSPPHGFNPSDPNASATLPPEILDKILEHVPRTRKGRQTIVACALVATWWTGPSQRRLFSSVVIDRSNYRRWMKSVVLPGPKTHLLESVRSLHHTCSQNPGNTCGMGHLAQDTREYFPALRNLRSLTFAHIGITHAKEAEFHARFSAFHETLTSLILGTITTSFGAFVTLVNYFPNITTLQLGSVALEADEGPIPSLSRPLRGRIHFHDVQANRLEFLDRFAKLDLEYEELVIGSRSLMWMRSLESVLRISTRTVRFLRLSDFDRE